VTPSVPPPGLPTPGLRVPCGPERLFRLFTPGNIEGCAGLTHHLPVALCLGRTGDHKNGCPNAVARKPRLGAPDRSPARPASEQQCRPRVCYGGAEPAVCHQTADSPRRNCRWDSQLAPAAPRGARRPQLHWDHRVPASIISNARWTQRERTKLALSLHQRELPWSQSRAGRANFFRPEGTRATHRHASRPALRWVQKLIVFVHAKDRGCPFQRTPTLAGRVKPKPLFGVSETV
jgi:hypothetical protein